MRKGADCGEDGRIGNGYLSLVGSLTFEIGSFSADRHL